MSEQLRLHAVTIVVDDYDTAIAHYVNDLGFTLLEDTDLGSGKRWVRVAPDANGPGLLLAKATTPQQIAAIGNQTGGRVGFFVHTSDFASTHARLRANGVHMTEEPRSEEFGTVVVFKDKYGNLWDLIEPRIVHG